MTGDSTIPISGGRVLGHPRWLKIDYASAKAGKVLLLLDTRKEKAGS
jgi:hypothetical protein